MSTGFVTSLSAPAWVPSRIVSFWRRWWPSRGLSSGTRFAPPDRFDPVALRHHDIHGDTIRSLGVEHLDGLLPVFSRANDIEPVADRIWDDIPLERQIVSSDRPAGDNCLSLGVAKPVAHHVSLLDRLDL